MHAVRTRTFQNGFTLPEVLIAAVLVAVFFAGIFEVNAICLRYISASKETVGAIGGVQDRLEQLRNLDFPSLTTTATMKTRLATTANVSPLAKRATETVTISEYPSGTPTITYARNSNGTVTSTPSTVDFGSTNLVRVDVDYQWQATFGRRDLTQQTSTIISAGPKK